MATTRNETGVEEIVVQETGTTTESHESADHGGGLHVQLGADQLGTFLGFPITNSVMTSIVGSVILVVAVWLASRKFSLVPSKMQLVFESVVEYGYNQTLELLDGKEEIARKVFPMVAALFLFILFFNLVKFIPGAESLRFGDYHLFRPLHADLNMTLALGVTAFIFVQFLGIYVLGALTYAAKYLNFKNPASLPIGFIELVSEFAKMFSLSFRLFGNIFAGGLLLLLAGSVTHVFLPIPIIFFEIFVAFLQAGIFALLTLVYVKLAVTEPH